jgi:hypothetical protein
VCEELLGVLMSGMAVLWEWWCEGRPSPLGAVIREEMVLHGVIMRREIVLIESVVLRKTSGLVLWQERSTS